MSCVKEKMRFVPLKRTALDGKVWWCVWDEERDQWSTYVCHGKYKTKREAQYAIDKYNKLWKI